MWDNGTVEKYCYANDPGLCTTYGGLYTWNEVMQWTTVIGTQGVCPSGWHVPSYADWAVLQNFLGGLLFAGGPMKTTGTFEAGTGLWLAPNTGATNSSGFSGLPGGWVSSSGASSQLGQIGQFWTSTIDASNPSKAWTGYLFNGNSNFGFYSDFNNKAFSVRCIKD
jgi:uncharacterized protein (TIGR02145 family)